ncbi:inner membrane protein YbaN [bacterium MnTg02]|nr:inner membrane protein YbaN [bacterium MnTg02]
MTGPMSNIGSGARGPLRRAAWVTLGVTSLVLGIIGIVVPLLPTTPFILLSAFAFERSSDRLHNWLMAHPRFGPSIESWRRYGAISRRAKKLALIAMLAVLLLSVVLAAPIYVILIQALVLTAVGVFILTRPLPPDDFDQV